MTNRSIESELGKLAARIQQGVQQRMEGFEGPVSGGVKLDDIVLGRTNSLPIVGHMGTSSEMSKWHSVPGWQPDTDWILAYFAPANVTSVWVNKSPLQMRNQIYTALIEHYGKPDELTAKGAPVYYVDMPRGLGLGQEKTQLILGYDPLIERDFRDDT